MKKPKKIWDEELKGLSEKDFDGHTEFEKLSAGKRLEWLSQMAKFLWKAKTVKPPKTR